MISYLEGSVLHIGPTYILVQVGGVGYKVFATPDLLQTQAGDTIKVFTYHKSTDEGQALYGVPTVTALEFFELLLTVSGVGPKIAHTIVSAGPVDILKDAIAKQDTSFFSQMAGVGKKTAERIIVDLKDKMGRIITTIGTSAGSSDVFDALIGLGYSTHEARATLTHINRELSTEEQLKEALKLLSKS